MNTDDSNEAIGSNQHKRAYNIRFREGRPEGVPGTTAIAYTQPAGNNECIGRFSDELKGRVFSFFYNSNGTHEIRQYTISTGIIIAVVSIGAQTDGDILGFTLDGPIHAVKMLYGDDVQGDELYFNNSQKQPCYINIKKALDGSYGVIKRSYIDVIKAPGKLPPAVVYEDDNTVTVNNLRKKLFQFRTRFTYLNKEKSVWSSISEMPLPINYTDTAIDKDPTKNCRIAVVVPTGESDVKEIEVAAIILPESAVDAGGEVVGWFTIANLNKSLLSISSNDLYTFRFYNNQAYLPCDPIETEQLQDLVPLEANALEFLNGNVPIYGAIKEGFNKTTILGSTASGSMSQRTTQLPYIFVASQSGDSGFGTGNIHAIVLGAPAIGDVFNIYTSGATISFTATAATTTNVITGLAAAAVVAGFTVVSSDTENLVIVKTGESLQRVLSTPVTRAVSDSYVYDRNARYNFGVQYFDAAGRTIGSETNATLPVQTINYTETTGTPNIPKLTVTISNRPPLHARYFQLTRTKNLSKLTKLEWVSEKTFKDKEFAYIGIENLNRFIRDNPSAKFLQYDFSPNDRIRFMKVLSGTVNTVYTNQDFEIQSQVLSPVINGEVQEGQYLKIALPTTTGTFDFGSFDFYNYFIELYTPAQSVSGGLDKYYEFGERYTIGNPGTANAYHQGMTQNQTADLVTPALFEFTKGDFYYRNRIINTGGVLDYVITAGERGAGRHTMGVAFVDRDFTDATITTGNSPLQNLDGWNFTLDSRAIVKMTAGAVLTTFRAKGTITVGFANGQFFSYFFQDNTGLITYAVTPRYVNAGTTTFTFDCTFQLGASQHISFLGWADDDNDNSKVYASTDFSISIQKPYTVGVIDPNFSDFFASAVNSNGRPSIVDINAAQVFNPTMLRWGLNYLPNSNINQTNRFREVNFDDGIDRSVGQIWVLDVDGTTLRIIQEKAVCKKEVYGKLIQDSNGVGTLTTTDDILTKNNADYYANRHGIGNQPLSFTKSKVASYFIDDISGEQIRLSLAGLDSISVQNKGEFYIKSLLVPYASDYIRANGSKAKIIQFFDLFENQCMTILQGGTLGGNTILPYLFSFNENRNAYCSFYDNVNGGLSPEMAISAQKENYFWKNGVMYIQNDEGNARTLLGGAFNVSITLVYNKDIPIKKKFLGIGYESNRVFTSPTNGDILTNTVNPQTGLSQISNLKTGDYELEESVQTAAFWFDANSGSDAAQALLNGDFLGGNWLQIKLIYSGGGYGWLYLPYVTSIPSNRNF